MATSKPTHIGVREFRDRASHYLSKGDALAIEKHGEVIGYYIPVQRDDAARKQALIAFEEKLAIFLEETGLSEEELAESLTIKRETGR
ncbi:MAG: hypothetical protein AAF267_17580 [Deinococcota bacterium]